jgi:hypothetical protein
MHAHSISVEPWQYGPSRKVKLPSRRDQIRRERDLRTFISEHRLGRIAGFTRLRTPEELAKLSREHGHGFKPMEIEYAAARAGLAVGEPPKY